MAEPQDAGMLAGVRVLELAGVGPVPFAGMLLADLGADVVRVDRRPGEDPYGGLAGNEGAMGRGRRSLAVDLRHPEGVAAVLKVASGCDVLIEGFRPGVLERLGLGPERLHGRHPGLVVARITGYGQTGPDSAAAGHDLTYLAAAGVLHAVGEAGRAPVPPLNAVADFGGGSMMLVVGILSALLERGRTGRGRVLDVAMTDGAAYLATMQRAMLGAGLWRDERGVNLLDGGAPNYRCYRTADDAYVAVAALEPKFWQALLNVVGLAAEDAAGDLGSPYEVACWPALTERLVEVIATRTRDEWALAATGTDACLSPVLTLSEAATHPSQAARGSYDEVAEAVVPRLPIRQDGVPPAGLAPVPAVGAHSEEVLLEVGYEAEEIARLRAAGVLA